MQKVITKQKQIMISYIALGSNQADPNNQLTLALSAINNIKNTAVLAESSLYCSAPMGPQDQPNYANAVVKIETSLSPFELLERLQEIELSQGRVRKELQWGPRTLDLDILLCDDLVIDTPILTIPHYGMKVREFVLYPLAEIDINISLPDGTLLSHLLSQCDKNGLIKVSDLDR